MNKLLVGVTYPSGLVGITYTPKGKYNRVYTQIATKFVENVTRSLEILGARKIVVHGKVMTK